MSKTDLTTVSTAEIRSAELIFHHKRDLGAIAEDCALDALRVLHSGLSHPDSRLRIASAQAILTGHCKLAALKLPPPGANAIPPEERVERLAAALKEPNGELSEALKKTGWVQVQE